MDFRKFLEMISEESTSEKDHKAEKAGKKVAKDIEYDEDHKGKDDDKAEKAGKKVTKDIEYDDKKDKKSLKDWFEHVNKEKLTESDLALPIIGKDGKQVSAQPGFMKLQGDKTPAGQAMAAALKDMVAKKQIQIVAPFDQSQTSTMQKPTAGSVGGAPATAQAMKSEGAEDAPPSTDDGELLEKWAGDAEVKPTGQYKDKTKEELKSMLAKLHKSGPHDKDSPAAKKMRQINFALRAKGGWKKGEGAAMKEEMVDEKAVNPYAIGMAAAKKSAGITKKHATDLPKKVVTKGHEIAKKIMKKEKTDEAEIPSSGPDYGAGLGAGRSDKVLEAKPDFLDLDKDGNKKESMKKAAADKKKKVKESMNTLEAAYHEGKAHGLSKHSYACRYNEGSEEHKRYHDGFKEGLDECYGLMPNRGLVVSEVDAVPATVPGMADQAEKEMGEGNAFTAALAKADKGEKFTVGGKTFTDRSNYDAKIDEFAFESLDKQLNSLLESEEPVQEGLSVNMSKGMGGMGEDTVSVSANGDDAGKLIDFIKQVGLGGLGGQGEVVGQAEPAAVVAVSDYGAPKFSGHDGMKDLMNKVSGGEDYKDEEGHDHDHAHEETCNECGMMEAECGCEKKEAVMGEVETQDQMTDQMAEDDGEGNIEADEQGAQIDAALATGSQNEKSVTEGGDGAEAGANDAAAAVDSADAAEEEEEAMSESVKLEEWANDAGKDGTEQSFERDIEFMTKVISGGLNKPKSTGQQTIPVLAGDDERTGDEDISVWKTLAGLKK